MDEHELKSLQTAKAELEMIRNKQRERQERHRQKKMAMGRRQMNCMVDGKLFDQVTELKTQWQATMDEIIGRILDEYFTPTETSNGLRASTVALNPLLNGPMPSAEKQAEILSQFKPLLDKGLNWEQATWIMIHRKDYYAALVNGGLTYFDVPPDPNSSAVKPPVISDVKSDTNNVISDNQSVISDVKSIPKDVISDVKDITNNEINHDPDIILGLIQALKADGLSNPAIAKALNAEGHQTTKGKQWTGPNVEAYHRRKTAG